MIINDKENDVIEDIFQSLLYRYQTGLEASMICNNFIFHFVHLCVTNVIK